VVPVDLKANNNLRQRVIRVPHQHTKSTVIAPFNEYTFKHSDRYAEERDLAELVHITQSFFGERDDEESDIESVDIEWGSYNDFGDS